MMKSPYFVLVLQFMIALGIGTMLGGALLHLIPMKVWRNLLTIPFHMWLTLQQSAVSNLFFSKKILRVNDAPSLSCSIFSFRL